MKAENNTVEKTSIEVLKIDEVQIFLQDFGPSQGKITISGYDHNYSYYWGAMGVSLKDFLKEINSGYFAVCLMGAKDNQCLDVPKTFAAIRKHIREEVRLPWYRFPDFQKDMREQLNAFQRDCEESPTYNHFVDAFFPRFINQLDFSLIEDRFDAKYVEEDFHTTMSEPWGFIVDRPSPEYNWLMKLHKQIKKALLKLNLNEN